MPGSRDVPEAGRVEVPLSAWTGAAIHSIVIANRIRLSPACELALRDALEVRARRFRCRTDDEPPEHDISIPSAGADVLICAEPEGPLAAGVAGLPGVRSLGRGRGRWVLPPSPQAARALESSPIATPADPRRRLESMASRGAAVDRPRRSRGARQGAEARDRDLWGEPPAVLGEWLTQVVHHARRILAPLNPANLKRSGARNTARSRGLLLLSRPERDELDGREPRSQGAPPAELDVIQEVDGPRYVIEPVWDERVETEFLAQESALARKHGCRDTEVPASAWPPDALARFIRKHRVALTLAARALIEGVVVTDDDAQRLLAMSKAEDAELEIEGLGGELMPFQRAGVAYALERRRVFLADEQGLGKTIQALATVQADLAYPAVVVCPASLKLNWLREIETWLPGRGAVPYPAAPPRISRAPTSIVLNYEIAAAHLKALGELAPRALILDESHYVKNPVAVRTKAILELVESLGPDALRLALTGTPVVNRPAELAPNCGRSTASASTGPCRASAAATPPRVPAKAALPPSEFVLSAAPKGGRPDAASGQAPRRRARPDLERRRVQAGRARLHPLALRAGGRGGKRALTHDASAEALIKMSALRRLAARGKLDAALTWIDDFARVG